MNATDYIQVRENIKNCNFDAIIKHIDHILNNLCGKTCVTKSRYFEAIISYYNTFPEFIRANYYIDFSAKEYKDRCFKKTFSPMPKMWNYPKEDFSGLYLIGQCIFNPYTHQEYYLVKIGQSSNINKRLKQYKTYNPHIYLIDTFKTKKANTAENLETICHLTLEMSHFLPYENTEWYQVDKDFYLSISQAGFSFFRNIQEFNSILKYYDRR